jgi:uncharacterized membrane protein (DUF373 family)
MLELVDKFERIIYAFLIILLSIVLLFAVGELGYLLFASLINPPPYLLQSHELTTILGAFLLILIGVELLDTIKVYFSENSIHFEIVILLAIIAIARKVILLDPSATNGIEYLGIGVLIIGLAGAYYLIKRSGGIVVGNHGRKEPETES